MLGKLNVYMQKNENRAISLCTKTNCKWIKDLNLESKTLKLLGKEVINLDDIGVRKDFLNRPPYFQDLRLATDIQIFIKLESFCIDKETVNQVSRKTVNQVRRKPI